MRAAVILLGLVVLVAGGATLWLDRHDRDRLTGLAPGVSAEGYELAGFAGLGLGAALLLAGAAGRRQGKAGGQPAKAFTANDEFFLRACAALITADKEERVSEKAMLRVLAKQFRKIDLSEEQAHSYIVKERNDQSALIAELKRLATVDDDLAQHIMRACVWITVADLETKNAEIDFLQKLAPALRVDAARFDEYEREIGQFRQKLIDLVIDAARRDIAAALRSGA